MGDGGPGTAPGPTPRSSIFWPYMGSGTSEAPPPRRPRPRPPPHRGPPCTPLGPPPPHRSPRGRARTPAAPRGSSGDPPPPPPAPRRARARVGMSNPHAGPRAGRGPVPPAICARRMWGAAGRGLGPPPAPAGPTPGGTRDPGGRGLPPPPPTFLGWERARPPPPLLWAEGAGRGRNGGIRGDPKWGGGGGGGVSHRALPGVSDEGLSKGGGGPHQGLRQGPAGGGAGLPRSPVRGLPKEGLMAGGLSPLGGGGVPKGGGSSRPPFEGWGGASQRHATTRGGSPKHPIRGVPKGSPLPRGLCGGGLLQSPRGGGAPQGHPFIAGVWRDAPLWWGSGGMGGTPCYGRGLGGRLVTEGVWGWGGDAPLRRGSGDGGGRPVPAGGARQGPPPSPHRWRPA